MTELNDQDMFHRTWYLPDQWQTTTSPNTIEKWRALLKKGNASDWTVSGYWKNFPYIFLVDRPLTFGHSQMVMPIPLKLPPIKENVSFEFASIIIKRAIRVFEYAFGEKELHTDQQFHDLAKRTLSYGRYIKTIIMRVSADEDTSKFYKVHLVPYFESNAEECQKRYCSIHRVLPDKRGGLIGWLGDKETKVERWQPGNFELTKLPKLASKLREILARQQMDRGNS